MNVKGLDNKIHKWKYTNRKRRRKVSSGHKRFRKIIEKHFAGHKFYEEVKLPCSKLYLDFFCYTLLTAIEINGRQHYEHIPHFHKTKACFLKAQNRDKKKEEFCYINEIDLVVLDDSETDKQWIKKLRRTFEGI